MKFLLSTVIFYLIICMKFCTAKEVDSETNNTQAWGFEEVYPDVHIFWWLYYADPEIIPSNYNQYNQPLLIWLGWFSTADTNFKQYGQLDTNFKYRYGNLVNDYNILFVDSIAGAGFSYTTKENLYPKNTHEITYDLLCFIKQFLLKYPKFETVPTYIVGDTYFGKIAVELAALWTSIGRRENITHNLQGIIVGNPMISPINTVETWYQYLTDNKLISGEQSNSILQNIGEINNAIDYKYWRHAFKLTCKLVESMLNHLHTEEDFVNLDSLGIGDLSKLTEDVSLAHLMNVDVRKALRIPVYWGLANSTVCFDNFGNDRMSPSFYKFEQLLNITNVKIMVLNTKLNLEVTGIDTLNWTDNIHWNEISNWNNAKYKQVRIDDDNNLDCYLKGYKNYHHFVLSKKAQMNNVNKPKVLKNILSIIMSL